VPAVVAPAPAKPLPPCPPACDEDARPIFKSALTRRQFARRTFRRCH
jgi:hypothetical protein